MSMIMKIRNHSKISFFLAYVKLLVIIFCFSSCTVADIKKLEHTDFPVDRLLVTEYARVGLKEWLHHLSEKHVAMLQFYDLKKPIISTIKGDKPTDNKVYVLFVPKDNRGCLMVSLGYDKDGFLFFNERVIIYDSPENILKEINK